MDSFDDLHPDTGDSTTTATAGVAPDRLAQAGLLIAVVASVLALLLEVTGPYLTTLIDSWNLDPRMAFNLFGFFNIYVVGILGIVALILGGMSLKRPPSRRGLAAAALALGSFHLAHMIIIPLATLLGPGP